MVKATCSCCAPTIFSEREERFAMQDFDFAAEEGEEEEDERDEKEEVGSKKLQLKELAMDYAILTISSSSALRLQ